MIDLFRIMVLGDIQACRYYLDAMDDAVPPARDRAFSDLKQKAESDSWGYEEYDCEVQELEGVYEHILPEVLCRSLVVYLHSRVEVQLTIVAADVKSRRSLDLDLKDLSGRPIDRIKTYLAKVAKVPVSDLPEWSVLRDLAKIRDVVVHRGGRLGSDPCEREKLRQLSLRYPKLLDSSRGWDQAESELQFGQPLCRHFISSAETMFKAILDHTRMKKDT